MWSSSRIAFSERRQHGNDVVTLGVGNALNRHIRQTLRTQRFTIASAQSVQAGLAVAREAVDALRQRFKRRIAEPVRKAPLSPRTFMELRA